MIHRITSTLVLWSILGSALFFFREHAGIPLLALLALASQNEMYRMLEKAGIPPHKWSGLVSGALLLPGAYYASGVLPGLNLPEAALCAFGLGVLLISLSALKSPCEGAAKALAGTAMGLLLIVFPLHFFVHMLALGEDPTQGLLLAVWVVVAVKFTDVGAYLAGTFFGRHKLAPKLSPGKTWEGVAGGMILSVLASATFAALPGVRLPDAMTPLAAAALAVPIAAASIPSDLLESVIKRAAGEKDSGRTIPGIGGAYDLTDSLILSAPVAYLLFLLFID